ncbi:DNA-binding protein [Streptomyces sp. WZ.A104]|uniref:Cold shock domain-containing protein n=1 Tax=Streptomyces durocortorensis TaxID=2811104 RepID=A0ABY9W3E8_9ACTN|nr:MULTISPECIES: cold shock domain-containing protein [Streptomyces]PCG82600.1 DNA-binding protein [Streptomyces sp. WZ.A104]WNF30679.1 cold shock domain-containing protein [Streptomyces durocortorensis]
MATGRVVRFDEVRGYGFVSPDGGGSDVFLHVNDLLIDKSLINPGVLVSFDLEAGDRGLKASAVSLASDRASSSPRTDPRPASAASHASAPDARTDLDDGTCEVLSVKDYTDEVTEALLISKPPLTGEQILSIRERMVRLAMSHGWVES